MRLVVLILAIAASAVITLTLMTTQDRGCPEPDPSPDPTWVCTEGPTLNDGAYEILVFLDEQGGSVRRSEATTAVLTEYGPKGEVVHTTWLDIEP